MEPCEDCGEMVAECLTHLCKKPTLREKAKRITDFCLNNVCTDKDGVLFYPDGVVPSVMHKLSEIRNEALEDAAKTSQNTRPACMECGQPSAWEIAKRIRALKNASSEHRPALPSEGK